MSIFQIFAYLRRDRDLFPRSRPSSAPGRKATLQIEALETRLLLNAGISGFVYNDLNADGLKEPGEPVIANSPIALLDSTGHTIATTVAPVRVAIGTVSPR